MAWDHLDINRPHLVYIILGGFTSLFMLCSSVIKERLYIGEATVATLCGIIFGPSAANLINPGDWGNTDQITLEFSRIVLVVQCFAVGVELPKAYMERHWRSVVFLLVPVMTFGWLVTSLFIWAFFYRSMNWLDSLCVAACVTATDPVLASSVVGKGKFAKRVPKHLRDLLSAESGCNDGMAFPFIYLALYLIKYYHEPQEWALHWFCISILYECVFGAIYGVLVGYLARRAIRYAHEKNYVDRESFLVFYFVLALFCAGSGSMLGMDDLLVGFAAGVGFSNDGWFTEKTEESHVSNVIDLLINLAFFVYFGTIIPWSQYNSGILSLDVWRLVVIAILVIFFRRIPIMMALKPLIPDIKTWREALFAGHFGPIGVGALFVAILARGTLETDFDTTTPLAEIPPENFPHYNVIELIWPITTFLVITSIIIHGSSVAVFTLGKHINTLTLTMSYTQANEQGPSWMERLPRIQSRSKTSMSMQRSDDEYDEKEKGGVPGMLPAIGQSGAFLRRQREEDNPSRNQSRASSRHRSRWSRSIDTSQGPGGPISQSAISPVTPATKTEFASPTSEKDDGEQGPWNRSDSDTLAQKSATPPTPNEQKQDDLARQTSPGEIYEEGHHTVYEDEEGNVLAVEESRNEHSNKAQKDREEAEKREGQRLMHQEGADHNKGVAPTKDDPNQDTAGELAQKLEAAAAKARDSGNNNEDNESGEAPQRPGKAWRDGINKMSTLTGIRRRDPQQKAKAQQERQQEKKTTRGPARAYQYGNTIIVEDEDGEVIKKYDIPAPDKKQGDERTQRRIGEMGKMLGLGRRDRAESSAAGAAAGAAGVDGAQKKEDAPADDDAGLRFTITTGGRRMSKAEFIDEIRQMDPKSRARAVEDSNAPETVKKVAREDVRDRAQGGLQRRNTGTAIEPVREQPERNNQKNNAGLYPIMSNESKAEENELKLVDSDEQDIPFHDISSELRKYQVRSGTGETAAERRRREALERHGDSDSEDDGTERVPPPGRAGPSRPKPKTEESSRDTGETAAERRRREAALGLRKSEEDEDSDDEDENSTQPGQDRGQAIRFADQQPQRQTMLRWGKNVGR